MTSGNTNSRPVVAPLAPLQGSLLAATLSDRSRQLYVTQVVFVLSETVDPARWSAVWQQLAARHEALRSVFVTDRQAEPVQVFLDDIKLDVRYEKLAATRTVTDVLEAEREEPLTPDAAPLLRVCVVDADSASPRHVMTFHHAILDGWSVELLMTEALSLYNGDHLAAAPGFRRYLAWYRKQRDGATDYWEKNAARLVRCIANPGRFRRRR